jgi:hypothetical protein
LQVFEQRDRARSPANKATGQADARVQTVRDGSVTIRGIELAEKIKKGQFNLATLAGKPATAPETWVAVLAA